jgi:hypothetical protein
MQDVLGAWHDQIELLRLTAEALADPDFLLSHSRLVAIVLRKADREQSAQDKRVRRLLAETSASVEGSALDHWIASYCAGTPGRHAAHAHVSHAPLEAGEPDQPRHASPHASELAPPHAGELASAHLSERASPQQAEPTAAPIAGETPDLAVSPEEGFVKAMSLLPR